MYNMVCASAQAGIAQLVEHFTRNEGVVSSSLISGFFNAEIAVSLRYFGIFAICFTVAKTYRDCKCQNPDDISF